MDGTVRDDASPGAEMKTPLYDRHVAAGAKMIPFAGWLMPVKYTGIIDEHRKVREGVGLFDLGHMGQVEIGGADALAFLQFITPNDVAELQPGQAHYSLLPNEAGGVVDDIIIYRHTSGSGYMICINASNRHKDVAWMQHWRDERSDLDVTVADISDRTGMIAIQGPLAAAVTQRITNRDLSGVDDFSWVEAEVGGVPARAARTGYTGEDGFEFYTKKEQIGDVWDALLRSGAGDGIAPIGLGARDTLRLEARMPLYGNELADDINPLEAGLGWVLKLGKGPFIGREPIAAMKASGPPRRTVGFRMTERSGSPRSHYEVRSNGAPVGMVTSGAMSPTLNENIGLAIVEAGVAGIGKPLEIVIRDKSYAAVQVKTPFYKRAR
jgi:aminomethyltransferase